jgi:hypothetical protein
MEAGLSKQTMVRTMRVVSGAIWIFYLKISSRKRYVSGYEGDQNTLAHHHESFLEKPFRDFYVQLRPPPAPSTAV